MSLRPNHSWATVVVAGAVALAIASPAQAQIGGFLNKAAKARDALVITDQQEEDLGAQVSQMLREKYGVVQDVAVTKYVTLVGMTLASSSTRPGLPWTFIVLDTPGVNAFAAPGGYIHITRGALALVQNEDELACVLAHEISHVTQKHAINAIKKSNAESAGADMTNSAVAKQVADAAYKIVLENNFSRAEEIDADTHGVALANSVGYSPHGLDVFLTRLDARDKGLSDKSGLFASHPDVQARLDGLAKTIKSDKLSATALVAARFTKNISYTPEALPGVPNSGSSGGRFGLGGLSSVGGDKSSSQTISAGGSRGLNPDRDAPGGPIKTLVPVKVTPAELADFRKGITG